GPSPFWSFFSASICFKRSICSLILLLFGRYALNYARYFVIFGPISLFSATFRWICPHVILVFPSTASCAFFPCLCSLLCLFGPNISFRPSLPRYLLFALSTPS
ncbi:unnamed protein product, partial [Ectocarpus sp. 13 AM-2016]